MVPHNLVQDLKEFAQTNFPDLKIVYKDEEGWQKTSFYTWVIWAFFTYIIRHVSPKNHDLFMTRYSNALPCGTLIFPSRKTHSDWSNLSVFSVVYHEVKHMLDMKKYPIWFVVSYLLVLPSLLSMRAYWEIRGYTATMLALFKVTGKLSEGLPQYYAQHFTGGMYLFMFPFKETVRKILEKNRQRILKGEITELDSW